MEEYQALLNLYSDADKEINVPLHECISALRSLSRRHKLLWCYSDAFSSIFYNGSKTDLLVLHTYMQTNTAICHFLSQRYSWFRVCSNLKEIL